MFRKNLVVLFLASVFALANVCAYANGGFTHVYIAQKSFDAIKDAQIKKVISDNIWAYHLGAHFPDVGYTTDNLKFLYTIVALLGGDVKDVPLSGKNYGEGTHWDNFLEHYQSILLSRYQHPFTDSPASAVAVAFILGVATHRVSDDIWHNRKDNFSPYYQFKFKSCNRLTSSFCYYGFISKLADLEALDWSYAHTVATRE